MKRILLFHALLLSSALKVFPETVRFDIDSINFFIAPKILNDGSITDIGFRYRYSEKISGSLRFRSTMISKNEELPGVPDSLNAVNDRNKRQ